MSFRTFALLTIALSSLAPAQGADSVKRKQKLDPVVVTAAPNARPSSVTLQSSGLPTAVSVITHDDIDRTNTGRDFGSLLRRVPGIMAHNIGQGNTGDSEKMRGFLSSTHGADVAVYIDGVPQNVPSAAINHGMNDMSWLTPDMIERIEVIKGPFSALYGDQNRSGAMNIITRSRADNSIGGTLSSYGTRRGALVLSGTRGTFRSLLVGDRFNTDGYRTNSGESRGTLMLKESATLGDAAWAVRGVVHKSDWNAPGFLLYSNLLNGTVNPTDADPTAPPLWGNAKRSSVVLTRTPATGDAGLHLSAYAEDYHRNRALGANKTDLNVQGDDRTIMGARAAHDMLFGDVAAVSFGAETRRDRGDAINRRWPAGAPGSTYTWNQGLKLLTYGGFIQAQVKPIEHVKLLGGARLDAFDYDIVNRKLPAASLKYKHSVSTPRGGIVISPIAALDLFANIGQGFRSPNQTEISPSGSLGPLGASGGTAYPDLAVPKVKSHDFGFSAVIRRLQVRAASYHTLNENEITQVAPGVFASVGNTTRDGWEVDSKLSVTESLGAYASYGQITRAKINSAALGTQDRIPVPKHTMKGGVAYTAPLGVELNVDASYISKVPYFAGTPLQLTYTRQYTRFDGRATREVRGVDITAFVTSQPVEFSAEAASATAAGLFIEPRPKTEVGIGLRYRFANR